VSNIVAQQLYLKYGFRPSGTRARYYTDNGEDALIMWTDSMRSAAYRNHLRQLREQLFERLREEASVPPPTIGKPPQRAQPVQPVQPVQPTNPSEQSS